MNTTRLRKTAKIDLIEFLRPGGYWPRPYSLEMAFSVLQQMAESGEGFFERHTWNTTSIGTLIGCSNADNYYPAPIKSIEDLRKRFHRALLTAEKNAPEVQRWRATSGFKIGETVELTFPHHKPFTGVFPEPLRSESDVHEMFNSMLQCPDGLVLQKQLNSVHSGARMVHDVVLYVGAKSRYANDNSDGRFNFVLRYGFKNLAEMKATGDSQWSHTLASSAPGEPFLQTLVRARTEFERCLQGELEQETEASTPRERCR